MHKVFDILDKVIPITILSGFIFYTTYYFSPNFRAFLYNQFPSYIEKKIEERLKGSYILGDISQINSKLTSQIEGTDFSSLLIRNESLISCQFSSIMVTKMGNEERNFFLKNVSFFHTPEIDESIKLFKYFPLFEKDFHLIHFENNSLYIYKELPKYIEEKQIYTYINGCLNLYVKEKEVNKIKDKKENKIKDKISSTWKEK